MLIKTVNSWKVGDLNAWFGAGERPRSYNLCCSILCQLVKVCLNSY